MTTIADAPVARSTRPPLVDARRWRRFVVLAHVLGSVAWMTVALALLALLAVGAGSTDPGEIAAAARMAEELDGRLLAPAANIAVFTGLVLGLATPWGLLAHRWMLVKLVLTVTQMAIGIAVLSDRLDATAAAGTTASPFLLAAPAVMAVVIAFQAWVSLAKPGGRTRWGRTGSGAPLRLATGPGWLFGLATVAVVVDTALAGVLGGPIVLAMPLVLVVAVVERARRGPGRATPARRETRAAAAATAATAG